MSGDQIVDGSAFSWTATEIVRELDHRPYLLVKLQIHGPQVPRLPAEPFVRVARPDGRFFPSWFATVSADGHLTGYFTCRLPRTGTIEFGFGASVVARLPREFDHDLVKALDRNGLPPRVIVAREERVAARLA